MENTVVLEGVRLLMRRADLPLTVAEVVVLVAEGVLQALRLIAVVTSRS
jgi:hypothetical protein